MPVGVKCLFTVAAVLCAIAIYFIDPHANNAGPGWLWRGRQEDPFRKLIFREDGSLRKHTKLGIYLWFEVWLALLWLGF